MEQSIKAFSTLFINNDSLINNNLRVEGIKALAESLKTNTLLTDLNIRFKALTTMTKHFFKDMLLITTNNFGNEGCKMIGELLKTNTSLTQLYLGTTTITTAFFP